MLSTMNSRREQLSLLLVCLVVLLSCCRSYADVCEVALVEILVPGLYIFLKMGLLFAKLWKHKIVIIGLDNAGKTTILYQFLMNEVVHTSPTLGSNVEEVVWKNIHFLMWDIGGQESLRQRWNAYYINTEFVILVIDSSDKDRLPISKEELWKMLACEDLRKAAVLIYANKQDVKGCLTPAEISDHLNLTAIKKHRWHIQACCALTGEGLYAGLEWIVDQLKSKS